MSQTLTKPILLDETGQAIKTALQNIDETESQDWLLSYEDVHSEMDDTLASMAESLAIIAEGGGYTKVPSEIKVTTRPDKRSYFEGETLDLTGIVVSVTYDDNSTADITNQCTFSPADGTTLTRDDKVITASWEYHGTTFSKTFTATTPLTITKIRVESITIVTEPTKTYYKEGEALDTTGLQVSATFNNGDVVDVTDECVIDPADGSIVTRNIDNRVRIRYTYDGKTVVSWYLISVEYAQRIEITTKADKRIYITNEELDFTGMVVTGYIKIPTSTVLQERDVTSDCTYSPAEGTVLSETGTETINISYGLATTSYTVTVADEPIYSWEDGTDEQVASMLTRHYDPNDDFNIQDYWNVGDIRVVQLGAMAGVTEDETYEQQYIELVLTEAGGKYLADGVTECAFQVDQKGLLWSNVQEKRGAVGVMNTTATNAGGWRDCERRTWCNTTYKNAIPSGIRSLFKQFKNNTSAGSSSSSIVTTDDYFALRSEAEVLGTHSMTYEGEDSQAEWFKTSSNRRRHYYNNDDNYSMGIWTRSPATSSNTNFAMTWTNSDGVYTDSANSLGNIPNICPFGVI